MRWSREQKIGYAVLCVLGATLGLFVGFIVFSVAVASGTGRVFAFWIARPSLYWPWPTFGAAIAGLSFYAVQTLRGPRQPMPEELDAKARTNAYHSLISKAVLQLPFNNWRARQNVYDRARMVLSESASKERLKREQVALEVAVRRFERYAPRDVASSGNPLHRPTTTSLVISLFFPNLWLIDVTCASLNWVARIPNR